MKITIRTPQMQDYDRFSAIMDQVQQMHVEWRPDVYKPASPLITKELFGELLKGDSWYIAETDGIVVGVLEVFKRHVEGPAQVTKDVLFVSTMAVDEAYRGKGIGHQFFDKVKQLKAEKGCDTIELQVNARNKKAYEMYRNYGFTEKSINMELNKQQKEQSAPASWPDALLFLMQYTENSELTSHTQRCIRNHTLPAVS